MTVADSRRMSEADRAGLAARSPEGHAAKSMHIREGSKREERGGWGKGGKNKRDGNYGRGKLWAERMVGYEKDGNYRRENYGRKEWESIRSMGIIGGKTMGGKSGRVSEVWEL